MSLQNSYVVIMAGGVGSRFWPASREKRPKQFLDILGVGKSLLRITYERFNTIVPSERILILTNKMYKSLILEHVPELQENNILLEPSRNNTAPCIAYAALRLNAINPKANFIVAPSDHVILKEEVFLNHIKDAIKAVSGTDKIVTLGIQPSRPDTGYGYIEYDNSKYGGISKVVSFKEKPNYVTAQKYINDGKYLWNAGIFIWSTETILSSFKTHAQEIYNILNKDYSKFNSSDEQEYIDEVYPLTPKISVDYAILEKSTNVYTIPVEIGWSDLGTWSALHNYKEKDDDNSVVIGDRTILLDTKNCMVKTDSEKLVVIKGLDNFIIIDEKDVLLVYPKSEEQSIKQLRQSLEEKKFV